MHTMKWKGAGVLMAVLAACGGDAPRESAHVKRAKELASIKEWASATAEVKLALKANPKDAVAQAWAVYLASKTTEEGDLANYGLLYAGLDVVQSPSYARHATAEDRKEADETMILLRKQLYDLGVDVPDAAGLRPLLERTAKVVFSSVDDDTDKVEAAIVLARKGDAAAVEFLIERLKGRDDRIAREALVAVGDAALPALERVVADREHLARPAVLELIGRLRLPEAIKSMLTAKGLGPLSKAEGLVGWGPLEEPNVGFLSRASAEDGLRFSRDSLYGRLVLTPGQPFEGIAVVQGWDVDAKRLVAQLFVLVGATFRPAPLTVKGVATPLGPDRSLIFGVTADGKGEISWRAIARKATTTEVPEFRKTPKVGDRVLVIDRQVKGTIRGRDSDGMFDVELDAAIEGISHLPMLDDAVAKLREETKTDDIVQLHRAKLDIANATLESVSVTDLKPDDPEARAAMTAELEAAMRALQKTMDSADPDDE